jgi:hypothetical protein
MAWHDPSRSWRIRPKAESEECMAVRPMERQRAQEYDRDHAILSVRNYAV